MDENELNSEKVPFWKALACVVLGLAGAVMLCLGVEVAGLVVLSYPVGVLAEAVLSCVEGLFSRRHRSGKADKTVRPGNPAVDAFIRGEGAEDRDDRE